MIACKLLASYLSVPMSVLWFNDEAVSKTQLNELYIDAFDVIDLEKLQLLNYIYNPKVEINELISQLQTNYIEGKTIVIETDRDFYSKTQFNSFLLYKESRNAVYRNLIQNNISGNLQGVSNGMFDFSNKVGIFSECNQINSKFKNAKNTIILNDNMEKDERTYNFYAFLISIRLLEFVVIDSSYVLDDGISDILTINDIMKFDCV
jgi:hypothetical protein|tara:strand:+ start:4805 stop:5422 length:618 start_codon:yes stop_codon:yes gene_type:complete